MVNLSHIVTPHFIGACHSSADYSDCLHQKVRRFGSRVLNSFLTSFTASSPPCNLKIGPVLTAERLRDFWPRRLRNRGDRHKMRDLPLGEGGRAGRRLRIAPPVGAALFARFPAALQYGRQPDCVLATAIRIRLPTCGGNARSVYRFHII